MNIDFGLLPEKLYGEGGKTKMEKAGRNNLYNNKAATGIKPVPDAVTTTATNKKKNNLGRVGRKAAKKKKKRSELYISLEAPVLGLWYKIDFECIPKATTNIEAVPVSEMQFPNLSYNYIPSTRCICLNSKIYVIGGYPVDDNHIPDPLYNSKMSIFDLSTKTWDHDHEMQVSRGSHTVVAIGNDIYVFGGESNVLEHGQFVETVQIPKEQWAEFYDTQSQRWEFLPTPPPQQLADSAIRLHAVYDNRHEILFWTDIAGVFSYNYATQTWTGPSEYSSLDEIETLPLSYRVAVVDDTLFWHYRGKIHAYELFHKHYLFAQSLDKSYTSFGDARVVFPDIPDPNFLLRVGKDALLLLFWDYNNKAGQKFQCYRFRISKSEDDLSLLPDGCGLFDISDTNVTSVMLIDVVLVA